MQNSCDFFTQFTISRSDEHYSRDPDPSFQSRLHSNVFISFGTGIGIGTGIVTGIVTATAAGAGTEGGDEASDPRTVAAPPPRRGAAKLLMNI